MEPGLAFSLEARERNSSVQLLRKTNLHVFRSAAKTFVSYPK